MGSNVLISRSCIFGFSDFFRVSIALLDDFLLFLDVFLGHFVKVKAVDFGVVSRRALLESIDGRSIQAVLDEAQCSGSKWMAIYSSVSQSSGRAVTKAV